MTTGENQVFGGRYELGDQIARGGTAQVYLARDLLLDRPVALKVLISELSSDSAFVSRFRREAQAAANLSHPNIVPIFDWGEADATYFIVMEYVDGEALSSIIRTQAPLAGAQAASIASDIAKALAYAHRHGVVHRDVKPGNVLITSDGQVKVTDFGIARAMGADEQVTQTGLVMGTATYFSPEQAQGFAVDGRSDVYSLGVVLYEMVTGKPPFAGDSPVSIAYQHVRERPQPPSVLNPGVPEPLETVILQAMAKSPSDRYQTADALRADLDRFARGEPVLARAPADDEATIAVPPVGALPPAVVGNGNVGDAETKQRRTTPYWVGSGGVFAIAIGLIIYFGGHSLGYFGGAAFFQVPSVTGMTEKAAFVKLESKGLDPIRKSVKGTTANTGKVTRQDPAPPAIVQRGEKVTVSVAGPPPTAQVPQVTSLTASAAESDLRSKGFKYMVKYVRITTAGMVQGDVVDQNPGAGTSAPIGDKVTITVVRGVGNLKVPTLAGQTQLNAESQLTGAGFKVGSIHTQYSQTVPAGTVIASNPGPGQSVTFGTPINLVVSGGNLIAVPSVVGLPVATAESVLNSDGLGYSVLPSSNPQSTPSGSVVTQGPQPGHHVRPNYPVKLFVNFGSTSTTTSTTLPTTSSTSGGPPSS